MTGVFARDRDKTRDVDVSGFEWFDDPVTMARSSSIDVLVELIGGSDGIAQICIEAALVAGKHVVTANK
ncbi:MAG: homoserine dehydrogenase, partial [Alphaproteobacteria bacterium]